VLDQYQSVSMPYPYTNSKKKKLLIHNGLAWLKFIVNVYERIKQPTPMLTCAKNNSL
jgi:hypothetical protein